MNACPQGCRGQRGQGMGESSRSEENWARGRKGLFQDGNHREGTGGDRWMEWQRVEEVRATGQGH